MATEDVQRLVEIDLTGFKDAYGPDLPSTGQIRTMFERRVANAHGWMFVATVDGVVEGFVTAFPTNKSEADFVSWELSTSNGTLDGVVEAGGKYAYIVNLTVNPAAMRLGAMAALAANLYALGVRNRVERAYFVSRIPMFRSWLTKQQRKGLAPGDPTADELKRLAEEYAVTRRDSGKRPVLLDPELRFYEGMGIKLGAVVADAFSDFASMDFGVIASASVPPRSERLRKNAIVRHALSGGLRAAARYPQLLEKVM